MVSQTMERVPLPVRQLMFTGTRPYFKKSRNIKWDKNFTK